MSKPTKIPLPHPNKTQIGYIDNPEDTKGSDNLSVLLLFVYCGLLGFLGTIIILVILTP